MQHRRRKVWPRALRAAWGLLAAALVLTLAPPAFAAEGVVVDEGILQSNPPAGAVQDDLTGALIVNHKARRAFQMFKMEVGIETRIRVLDLDTLKPLGEVAIKRNITPPGARSAVGNYLYALDEERNILYLPFSIPGQSLFAFEGLVVIDGNSIRALGEMIRSRSSDPTAAAKIDDRAVSDDGDLLDIVTPCTATSCRPSVPGVQPYVVAMDLVPPFLSGGNPKVIMLWGEPNCPGCELNSNVAHVVQWDGITGRQDFIYQVRACMNRGWPSLDNSRYPLSIFQARLGSGIYLGCSGSGGTGQVVRVVLDGNGQPTSEETFPGPTNVADILADKEDDRLLFRVTNEEGESYWVFNGTSSSYSGVVGTAIQPVATGAGVDPSSGRLYVLAPPHSVGNQSNPGGLLMSDIRRAPAPQALQFPEYADKGYATIVVDPGTSDGTRRLFVRPAGSPNYRILRDEVPVTFDPPLTDLDRFTVDVREDEGVTGVNFTGTGHAYGLRALIVGGLEGVPPTTADASGIRIGRYTPRQLGSPCMGGDRVFVAGSVQEAQLSNNLSNAAAAASETDAGTITDVRQPTQRCYPKPRVEQGPDAIDPFSPLYPVLPGNEYPRPVDTDTDEDGISDSDERAGGDWPFGIAQCASGGADTKPTKTKPVDRGDDIPADVRNHELELEGFRADVKCDLEGQDVIARAEAGPFEQQSLPVGDVPKVKPSGAPADVSAVPEPSEMSSLRVAEVSSFSQVKRIKGIGLVSESFAYARGINIGGKVFIDAAFTYARARAAGRPGTAATEFVRRLCGVRIPELNMHVSVIDEDLEPIPVGDPVYDKGGDPVRRGIDIPPFTDSLPSRIDLPDTGVLPPEIGIPRDAIPKHVDVPHQDLGEVDPLNPDSDDQTVNDRQVNDICGDPGLQQAGSQPVIDAMNRVLGSRARVAAPSPDTELRQGSPGGYLASIQKDRLHQIGARSVQNDDSTQVPAMEVVFFNDDPTKGRGRQLYQFAGVDASVTYGIYLLNPETGLPPECLPCALPDLDGDGNGYDPPPPPPPSDGAGELRPRGPLGPIKIIYEGVTFLLRSPKDAALAAAVWALLFSPMQLMMRRRALRGA